LIKNSFIRSSLIVLLKRLLWLPSTFRSLLISCLFSNRQLHHTFRKWPGAADAEPLMHREADFVSQPQAGWTVIDLGMGWAGPLAARKLAVVPLRSHFGCL
jgi:hypothetical protein